MRLMDKHSIIKIQNTGLYYDKLLYLIDFGSIFLEKEKNSFRNKNTDNPKNTYKDKILSSLSSIEPYEHLITIRNKMITSLKKNGKFVYSFTATLKTPALIGTGIPSIDEIGFYWNRNYGIPTIPGSSIKGAFSSYFYSDESFDKKLYDLIFGTKENAGKVEFLEAIPKGKFSLLKEIQAPHFGNYYQKNLPPNDVYNPIILSFLSINSKTEFIFDFVIDTDKEDTAKEILCLFEKSKKNIMEIYGLGAKTSMGYGRFKV